MSPVCRGIAAGMAALNDVAPAAARCRSFPAFSDSRQTPRSPGTCSMTPSCLRVCWYQRILRLAVDRGTPARPMGVRMSMASRVVPIRSATVA